MRKTAVFIAVLALATVFLFFYVYKNQSESEIVFYGNVETRTVNLGFRFLGKIDKIYKDEGETVSKEEIVAKLDSGKLKISAEEISSKLKAEKIKLEKLKGGFRDEEVRQALGEFEQASANLKFAQDTYQRQERLLSKNATSAEFYANAKYNYEAAEGALEKARAAYDLRQKGYEKEDIEIQKAVVVSLEASLKSILHDIEDSVLRSPADGVILSRIREEGSVVNPGERIFEISKQDEFWVRAYADEPYLGLISQGDEVLVFTDVRKEAYSGIVGHISPVAEFTPKNIETADLRTDLVFSFRVLIKEPDTKIKQGLPVTIKLKNAGY